MARPRRAATHGFGATVMNACIEKGLANFAAAGVPRLSFITHG